MLLLLGWLLVPPAQGAQPAHITLGAIGPVAEPSWIGKVLASEQPQVTVRTLAGKAGLQGLDLVLIANRPSLAWTPAERDLIQTAFAAGLPLVTDGAGEPLRELCGLAGTVRPDALASVRLYACRLRANGTTSGYYLLQDENPPAPETTTMRAPATGSNMPSFDGTAPQASVPTTATPQDPWSPLEGVLDWLAPDRGQPLLKASAWESAWDDRWQDASHPTLFICTWDFWVSKLTDNKTGRDFYSVEVKPDTEIRSYTASYSSQVGWFIESRTTTLDHDAYDSYGWRASTLVEYQPATTLSGGSVGWTIGGSVSADIGLDPSVGGGLVAEYSRTMNLQDVTMLNESSLYDAESSWRETYLGPNYEWWPISMSQPCAAAHTTHYSSAAAIVSVASDPALITPPLTGIGSSVYVSNRIGRDYGWHWVDLIYVEWSHQAYTPSQPGVITVYHNRPPVINEYNPSNDLVNTEPHVAVNFDVTAYDVDGTVTQFEWYLDDVWQANGDHWSYSPMMADVGSHLVQVVATDLSATDDQIWTVIVSSSIGVGDPPSSIPPAVVLEQNFPNPFNPQTRIAFGIPHAGLVRIDVYDVVGAHVRTLVDREMAAGMSSVQWNGLDDRGTAVATGIYLIRLKADGQLLTTKAVLAR